MKKLFLFWSVAAMLLGSACSKTETVQPDGGRQDQLVRMYVSDETTEAEAAANPQSRAYFADGYKIAWEAGDQVAIVSGTPYTVQQDASGGWYVELPQADSYTVYYPAALCGYLDNGTLITTIPYTQTYRAGSFDPAALPARAVANRGEKLTFKYMCSVIKLTLKGTGTEQVSKIELSTAGTGGERFCSAGLIETEADGTAYLAPMTGEYVAYTRTLLTLNAGNTVLSDAGTDFYMTVMPTTFSRGFTVTVTLADGRKMIKTGGVGQTVARGRILAMPALTFVETDTSPVHYSTDNATWIPWTYAADGATPVTLAYPETSDHTLYFKDNPYAATPGLTRAHLQSLADTFRSRDEATAQPIRLDMGQATLAGTTEFPSDIFCGAYWNGVVDYNRGDKALTGIVFPNNMTRIADMSITATNFNDKMGAFVGCQALVSVEMPEGISYIGSGAFTMCSLMSSFSIPGAEGELTIGKYAFWTSRALTEFRCERTTPPTLVLDGTNTPFNGVGTTGLVIRVPAASLAAYQADASWQKVIAEGSNRSWATF